MRVITRASAALALLACASVASAADCFWGDPYSCLDRNSITRSGTVVSANLYMCYERNVGPGDGRCDAPNPISVDCTTVEQNANGYWKYKPGQEPDAPLGSDWIRALCS
jgi:hypothetical protein